ncbi:MAG: beta-lactamase/D-alanine carboxypeptidase [Acidimicrobiales bacterium]|nr:beta-lactamase/D-alanine carboxypeptidase [Acidimicrobiales bacterium]
MPPLSAVDTWPVPNAAAATINFDGSIDTVGDTARPFQLASVTKLLTTWATLVAVEDGSLNLDMAVGQPGCTLRHLLSHAGGYPFSGTSPMAPVARRRIYSNSGIELVAATVETATGIGFGTYLREAVFEPLGMNASVLESSAAYGVTSTVADMIAFVRELTHPTLVDPSTVAIATTAQFPELAGRVPGVGVFRPCPWGLGFELHDGKAQHWMGATNSAETFGHFGAAGTMLWVDPIARTSLVALTDRRFDEWSADALRLWPALSDAVVADADATRS